MIWEYKTFRKAFYDAVLGTSDFDDRVDAWLNELGKDGWEIIKITGVVEQYLVLMKRPRLS
jgi:hypothetical protein